MGECILVVDDDREIVKAISILLEGEGYEVLTPPRWPGAGTNQKEPGPPKFHSLQLIYLAWFFASLASVPVF